MALILSIDTATENAGISLSMDGSILAMLGNEEQKATCGLDACCHKRNDGDTQGMG